MKKLKGFISYAHEDEDYFLLLKEGFEKHGKNSGIIDADLWADEKIPLGARWHEVIQEQVSECDFAVLLVSHHFLASDYIEEHEFRKFLRRQEEEDFLFFPLLIGPCDFSRWEELAARQFFKPPGMLYGRPDKKDDFTFADLVQYTNAGKVLKNPNRERYIMQALARMEEALQEYQQRRDTRRKIPRSPYFKIRPLLEMMPAHFLETRAKPSQGFHSFYLYREYLDDAIVKNYHNNTATLITGKPLAGKTRAVYEFCKRIKDKEALILIPERIDIDPHNFRLPETNLEMILFFDEFDQFLSLSNLDVVLKTALLHPRTWIVATCRGDKRSMVEDRFAGLFHNFAIQKIKRLGPDEEEELLLNVPDVANRRSDGTVGGYFLPLDEMHKQYRTLPKGSLEREILHACKAMQIWGRVRYDGSFDLEKIKDYCRRRLQHYYFSDRRVSPFEWDKTLKDLERKNLIDLREDAVAVEKMYLAFVEAGPQELQREILSYYPSVINYTKFINQAPGFAQARSVMEQMKEAGLEPDVVAYNSLIQKAPDTTSAREVFAEMKATGVLPDAYTFSALVNKAPDFDEARRILSQMEQAGLAPDRVTFSALLKTAPGFEQARAVFAQMEAAGLRPDQVAYNTLLNKAPDFDLAQAVLRQMKAARLKPTEVTYNSLLNKASDFEQARSVLEPMQRAGLKPNDITFSALLNKAPDFGEGQDVLQEMGEAGVRPDAFTFSTLLNKAGYFEQARTVLEQMTAAGIRADKYVYTSLLKKARNMEQARTVWTEMTAAGVRPDEVAYNTLLDKAPTFEEARGILEQMERAGLRPDKYSFSTLLKKASDFTLARDVLNEMQEAGVYPDAHTYSALMHKSPDYAGAREILDEMDAAGVRPDAYIFSLLLKKAPGFSEALELVFIWDGKKEKWSDQVCHAFCGIAARNRETFLERLEALPPAQLLSNPALNLAMRKVALPAMGAGAFFEKYFSEIVAGGDSVILLFADFCRDPEWKAELAERLRNRSWQYLKLKADAQIGKNWRESHRLLEKALQMENLERKARVGLYAVWAKAVVFNQRRELYSQALQYCEKALRGQEKKKLSYTARLFLWLFLHEHRDDPALLEKLRQVVRKKRLPRTKARRFLQEDLWEGFPTDDLTEMREKIVHAAQF